MLCNNSTKKFVGCLKQGREEVGCRMGDSNEENILMDGETCKHVCGVLVKEPGRPQDKSFYFSLVWGWALKQGG